MWVFKREGQYLILYLWQILTVFYYHSSGLTNQHQLQAPKYPKIFCWASTRQSPNSSHLIATMHGESQEPRRHSWELTNQEEAEAWSDKVTGQTGVYKPRASSMFQLRPTSHFLLLLLWGLSGWTGLWPSPQLPYHFVKQMTFKIFY